MKEWLKRNERAFSVFGFIVTVYVFIYIGSFFVTQGANAGNQYCQSSKELADKYFVCSDNMELLGERICEDNGGEFRYYSPVGFMYGKETGFEQVTCTDSKGHYFDISDFSLVPEDMTVIKRYKVFESLVDLEDYRDGLGEIWGYDRELKTITTYCQQIKPQDHIIPCWILEVTDYVSTIKE